MRFQALVELGHASGIAAAQPPMVDAAPGPWPFWVGMGATPTCVAPCGQGAAELDWTQTVGYQFDPTAMASLPCFMRSGGWPTESVRKSCGIGAPSPLLHIVL